MTPSTVILEALESFLRSGLGGARENLAGVDGLVAYQTKIAANLLSMLRREQELAPALASWDQKLAVHAKLATDTKVLEGIAVALRDGRLEADDALIGLLRQRTLTRLQIDNPRYSGCVQAEQRWSRVGEELMKN
ncbi:MAG: DUF6285 domain-containing protein [Pseudomonadota bacterium]